MPIRRSPLARHRSGSLMVGLAVAALLASATPDPVGAATNGSASSTRSTVRAASSTPAGRPTPAAVGVVTPERFGAKGNGRADDTRALQRALDTVKRGGTVMLRRGATYRHTKVLHVHVAGSVLRGKATLLATVPARSSVWIEGARITVDGPTLRTVNVSHRYYAYEQMGLRIAGAADTVIRNVKVVGSAAAGIYVGASCCSGPLHRANRFRIEHVSVSNTHADGIHMTSGSSHGIVTKAVTSNTGDDGIAVVSYQNDRVPCRWITVSSSRVKGTSWGRGVSVVGGSNITYRKVRISRTNAAGVYLAQEAGAFNTMSTRKIVLQNISIDHANTNPRIGHGAVLVYSATAGRSVGNIRVSNLKISKTTRTAPWEIGIRRDRGSVDRLVFDHVTIASNRSPFAANVGAKSYSARSWKVNGRSIARVTAR